MARSGSVEYADVGERNSWETGRTVKYVWRGRRSYKRNEQTGFHPANKKKKPGFGKKRQADGDDEGEAFLVHAPLNISLKIARFCTNWDFNIWKKARLAHKLVINRFFN